MGMVDVTAELSDEQSLAGSGTDVSDAYDLGASASSRTSSIGGQFLTIVIREDFTEDGLDPATHVQFSLESDSAATLASSPVVHWQTPTIALATLQDGYVVTILPLPLGETYKRYLGVRYTVSGGAPGLLATGAVSAYITPNPSLRTIYPNSI